MKRFFLFLAVLFFCAFDVSAQNDVTKFLGIPVDGFKSEMLNKLRAKGYTKVIGTEDILEGEFNGRNVYINVQTNNNKVWRIAVVDKNAVDEGQIKIHFNNLCKQFENNPRYIDFSENGQQIPEDEKISYEIIVHNKQFEATYYQRPQIDSAQLMNDLSKFLAEKYAVKSLDELQNVSAEEKEKMKLDFMAYSLDIFSKKVVWFMIKETLGGYSLAIFYENRFNMANGEEL